VVVAVVQAVQVEMLLHQLMALVVLEYKTLIKLALTSIMVEEAVVVLVVLLL
jgi:hypothetical protein